MRHRVFCASLADVAEIPEREDTRAKLDRARELLWELIDDCGALDWLLLTKRPENLPRVLPASWLKSPRKNVWLMTSAENQEQADIRVPLLLKVPAVVHGVSAEPMLGPIATPPARLAARPLRSRAGAGSAVLELRG